MDIFSIHSQADFESACLATFRRQAVQTEPYARYIGLLGVDPAQVQHVQDIPFMPIEFFKSEQVVAGGMQPQVVFTSSGTTGADTSRHLVPDVQLYQQSFLRAFELFYGPVSEYCILALLPNYLERQGSSLVYMVEHLITLSGHPLSGFFLHDRAKLAQQLQQLRDAGQRTLLIGVSFALLDMAEEYPMQFPRLIVMETGGMKGRRRELPRAELHHILSQGFGVQHIHSEYGMTELLSQAYSKGDGVFHRPPWMDVRIRDVHNPFACQPLGAIGGVNIIDLANQHSCSFIETQDLGRLLPQGGFEILGRIDHSLLRGCNMLLEPISK